MVNDAKKVAIFGGDGCRDGRDEVIQLAQKLKAPVGYSFRGKQWLEHDNPNAVGMTGLLGYGGAYGAINDADLLLLLCTDFPFSEFLPGDKVKKVQIEPAVASGDRELLEDLVAAAVNDAVHRVEARIQEKMAGAMAGMQLPPGMKLPF